MPSNILFCFAGNIVYNCIIMQLLLIQLLICMFGYLADAFYIWFWRISSNINRHTCYIHHIHVSCHSLLVRLFLLQETLYVLVVVVPRVHHGICKKKIFVQFLWKSRCQILVTFLSYDIEKLNCVFIRFLA